MAQKKEDPHIATNRTSRRDYHILESVEAGIVLKGTEVKSIRAGKVNINDAFARVEQGQAILYQCDIAAYDKGNIHNHEPRQSRKLLLHKSEIIRLAGMLSQKNRTLAALEMYWKNGHVKIRLGLAEGKTHDDRREDIKSKAAKKEMDRALKNRLKMG